MNTTRIARGSTRMVAHRGVSAIEKENTLPAFIAAGNRSYWGVETDIHPTADGKLVTIHDSNTLRVSGMETIVEKTDFEALRALSLLDVDGNAGRKDLFIPSFREYLQTCKRYEKNCVIEIKRVFSEAHLDTLLAEIREEDYLDHVVFIAFKAENLIHLRERCPEQKLQLIVKSFDEEVFALLKRYRFDLDIEYSCVTEELICRLHKEGIEVNCWQLDDPAIAEQLISWGVDYITTNRLE